MDAGDIAEHAEIIGLVAAGIIFAINLVIYELSLPLAFTVATAASGIIMGVCRQSEVLGELG